ncbi:MAG: sulfate/thiosulfate transport system permease protein [Actinomycetota bacterium]|jgi:sulfate transport system permease protein|nr:sulfate/thiosulfate transport system permease protein [Actinomycetota bacterium]
MSTPAVAVSLGGRRQKVVRGLLLTLCLSYVVVLLFAPFVGIVYTALKGGISAISETLGRTDVRHAYYLTAIITVLTVLFTTIFGIVVAWVLARDRFRGRAIMNALVDLPFAVSPVIVGLTAVLLFGRGGWFEPFFDARGIQIIFALPSMILVTAFICIPFVIRSVAPILDELGTDEEEAAITLGASPRQTFFRVTLPNIRWGLLYGTALATARSLGEVGAVLIVSGAIQGQTETVPLFILRALEERQEAAGYLIALSLAAMSILILLGIEFLKRRQEKERSL